jgi:hypothetical protein
MSMLSPEWLVFPLQILGQPIVFLEARLPQA